LAAWERGGHPQGVQQFAKCVLLWVYRFLITSLRNSFNSPLFAGPSPFPGFLFFFGSNNVPAAVVTQVSPSGQMVPFGGSTSFLFSTFDSGR